MSASCSRLSSIERWALILAGTLALVLGTAAHLGVRLNLSGSLPIGLYRQVRGAQNPERGAIVLACLSPAVSILAYDRGYVPRGGPCARGLLPIGKVVVALPGDTVTVTQAGITVDGALLPHSGALATDRNGKPLPHLPAGEYQVRAGGVWLLAPSDRSFDSRYIGELNAKNIRAQVRPLWIGGEAESAFAFPEIRRKSR